MKTCSKCNIDKPLSSFGKDKQKSDGLTSKCKYCQKDYYKENKESVLNYRKQYYKKNKEVIIEKNKQYYQENEAHLMERSKQWRKKNKEAIAERNKQWYMDNREVILEKNRKAVATPAYRKKRNENARKRRANDPLFRMIHNLRAGLWQAMAGTQKTKKTMELLGCSQEYLRDHLSAQFTEGMTLENYGLKGWHIDHIQPVDDFDHNDPEQVAVCWHYTNLQPMWWRDNIIKSNKTPTEHQVNLL